MKHVLYHTLLLIFLMGGLSIVSCNATPSISLDRVYKNVENEHGELLGVCYFEKPTFERFPAEEEINNYFNSECTAFFYGSAESKHYPAGSYNYFVDCINSMRALFGDDTIAEDPFQNRVDTEIMYQDDTMVSMKFSYYWMAGGVNDHRYFADTINLNTGDPISLETFVDSDITKFNTQVINLLVEFYLKSGVGFDKNIIESLYLKKSYDDYEYYFDGESVYLIFEQDAYYNDGYILRYSEE